jgi:hypothetical protein
MKLLTESMKKNLTLSEANSPASLMARGRGVRFLLLIVLNLEECDATADAIKY